MELPRERAAQIEAAIGDDYLALEILGQGASGLVVLAEQRSLGRRVVIKILHTRDSESIARFSREARILMAVSHSSVASLLDCVLQDDVPYLVFPYLPGKTLADILENGRQGEDLIRPLLVALSEGLVCVHATGILHRDIKPSNIWMSDEGGPMFLDFGLGNLAGDASLTEDGVAVGTPAYTAPEVVIGDDPTPRADLYSLGVVLAECLLGHNPFEGPTLRDTISRHLNLRMERVLPDHLPRDLRHVAYRLLNKNPDHRPEDARELLALLATDTSSSRRRAASRQIHQGADPPAGEIIGPTTARLTRPVENSKSSSMESSPHTQRLFSGRMKRWIWGGMVLAVTGLLAALLTGERVPASMKLSVLDDRKVRVDSQGGFRAPRCQFLREGGDIQEFRFPVDETAIEIRDLDASTTYQVSLLSEEAQDPTTSITLSTPPLLRVWDFVCWISNRSILIDFQTLNTPRLRIEMTEPGDRDRTFSREVQARSGTVHEVLDGLSPDTWYSLSIGAEGRWGGLKDLRIKTEPDAVTGDLLQIKRLLASGSVTVRATGLVLAREYPSASLVSDLRVLADSEDLADLNRIDLARTIGVLRDRESADLLLASSRAWLAELDASSRAEFLHSLTLARLTAAAERLASMPRDQTHFEPGKQASLGLALARLKDSLSLSRVSTLHDPEGQGFASLRAFSAVEAGVLRAPTPLWARFEKAEAKGSFSSLTMPLVASGLVADAAFISILARAARRHPRPSMRGWAVLLLSALGRSAEVVDALKENPGSLCHLWAAVKSRALPAIPILREELPGTIDDPESGQNPPDPPQTDAQSLAQAGDILFSGQNPPASSNPQAEKEIPHVRHLADHMVGLALLGDRSVIPMARRWIESGAKRWRPAAVWVLGQLEDVSSRPRIETLALSDGPTGMAALWALGRIKHPDSIPLLEERVESLSSIASDQEALTPSMAAWALSAYSRPSDRSLLQRLSDRLGPDSSSRSILRASLERLEESSDTEWFTLFPFTMFLPTGIRVRPENKLAIKVMGRFVRSDDTRAEGAAGLPEESPKELEPGIASTAHLGLLTFNNPADHLRWYPFHDGNEELILSVLDLPVIRPELVSPEIWRGFQVVRVGPLAIEASHASLLVH